jgi:hypothetical protein
MIPDPCSRYVPLHLRSDMIVRRDDGGLINARQNAIIGVGRHGSQCRWIESLDGSIEQPDDEQCFTDEREYAEGEPEVRHETCSGALGEAVLRHPLSGWCSR